VSDANSGGRGCPFSVSSMRSVPRQLSRGARGRHATPPMLGSGARRRHATRARRWPLEGPSRPLNSTPRERLTGSWPVLVGDNVGDDHLPCFLIRRRPGVRHPPSEASRSSSARCCRRRRARPRWPARRRTKVGQFGLHDGPCSFTRFILYIRTLDSRAAGVSP
jgi:hypothetical protein